LDPNILELLPLLPVSELFSSLSFVFVVHTHTTMKVLFKKEQGISRDIDIPKQALVSEIEDPPAEEPQPDPRSDLGERRANHKHKNKRECSETDDVTLAKKETKAVNVLRALFLVLLLVMTTLASMGVYLFAANGEKQNFEAGYQANAERVIESFHGAVARRLGAINSMSTAITSYALDAKQTFPFVTIPHFEIRGSDLRVQTDAAIVFWMPLVTDETRVAWEEYALANRYQIDESFEEDAKQREAQDNRFGLTNTTGTGDRMLQQSQQETTILDDGTGYHPRIWSIGASSPRGDKPEGSGPYLPLWQRR
jgi:hypothetical protein